jgi:hypothetical protein
MIVATRKGYLRIIAVALLATAGALLMTSCSRQNVGTAGQPGDQLPDFSGWWFLELKVDGKAPTPLLDAPLKPEIAAVLAKLEAGFEAGDSPDPIDMGAPPGYMCVPPSFFGFNGFGEHLEFLFTPQRVTVLYEGGLVRRIALGKTEFPIDMEEMNAGTSIGHWEGQTLVVETRGLAPGQGPLRIGSGARVLERISLAGPDNLDMEVTLTAPELLTAPFTKHLKFRRVRDHVFHEELVCVPGDRSIDPKTGRQRFDMTPPKDLPPPPAD